MAHVHEHAELLCASEEALALLRQPLAGLAGAGQAVRQVPHERDHPHARLICKLQQSLVLAHGFRALNGEKGGALARLHGGFRLRRGAAEGDPVFVFAQLCQKIVQRAGKMLCMWHARLDPRGAEREELGVAAKPRGLVQRHGKIAAAQLLFLQPELDRRVAVAVKYTV